MDAAEQNARERLLAELRGIAAEAQSLIEVKGQEFADRTKDLREHLAGAIETADQTLEALETRAEEGVKVADRAIRSHPYQSVGIALGVGVLLGLLMKGK